MLTCKCVFFLASSCMTPILRVERERESVRPFKQVPNQLRTHAAHSVSQNE